MLALGRDRNQRAAIPILEYAAAFFVPIANYCREEGRKEYQQAHPYDDMSILSDQVFVEHALKV